MAKKPVPSPIPMPTAVQPTAVVEQTVQPVDLPMANIPEAPAPVPVVTVTAPPSAPVVPVTESAPSAPVAPEDAQPVAALPAIEHYVIVEAIREGFVKNARKLPGTQFPWPASRKLASWMKLVQQ